MWLVITILDSPALETLRRKDLTLPPTTFSPGERLWLRYSWPVPNRGRHPGPITPTFWMKDSSSVNRGGWIRLSSRPHHNYRPGCPLISDAIFSRALSLPVPQFPHLSPEVDTCSTLPPQLILGEVPIFKLENQWEEIPMQAFFFK